MKKYLLLLLFLFFIPKVSAEEERKYRDGYRIDEYYTEVYINKDNTYDVTEIILFNFKYPTHYIDRFIPCISHGQIDLVENIDVPTHPYEVNYENGYCIISAGDGSQMNSMTRMTFKYTINAQEGLKNGDFKHKDYDSSNSDLATYNVIPTGWDTYIYDASFKIILDPSFEPQKIKGYIGSIYNSNSFEDLTVNGNVITGEIDYLSPDCGITVDVFLPNGTLKGKNKSYGQEMLIYMMISTLIFVAVLISWYAWRRKRMAINIPEFYPPEGLFSAEIGQIYNINKVNLVKKSLISSLIDLAKMKYIKIVENEEYGQLIIKIRNYDGDNPYLETVMHYLFPSPIMYSKTVGKSEISSCLGNRDFLQHMKKSLRETKRKNKDRLSILFTIFGAPIIIIPSILYFAFVYEIQGNVSIVPLIFLGIFNLITFILCRFLKDLLISCLCAIMVGGLTLWCISGADLYFSFYSQLKIVVVINYILYVASFIMLTMLTVRNKEGSKLYGRIKGFRNFLLNAKKEELELLVHENPEYYFDVLSYVYALDLSDVWCKKFEDIDAGYVSWWEGDRESIFESCTQFSRITKPKPVYYDSSSDHDFSSRSSSSSSSGRSSTSSYRSGGGYSGGGRSGGGHGGGGGRRR